MRVDLFGSITEIPQETWDRLSTAAAQQSYQWLHAQEGRVADRHWYLLVSDNAGQPLGGAALFLHDGTERHLAFRLPEVLAGEEVRQRARSVGLPPPEQEDGWLAPDELMHLLVPTLVCAVPSAYVPGLVCRTPNAGPVVTRLLERIDQIASDVGARSVALFNVERGRWPRLTEALTASGFVPVTLAAEAVLELSGGTFDDYAAGLGSGNRAREVRRERRRFLDSGAVVRLHGPDRLLCDDLIALQVEHHVKYGWPRDPAAVRDRFERTSRYLSDRIHVLTACAPDGALLGYTAAIAEPFTMNSSTVDTNGALTPIMTASAPNDVFAYFNLVFYELIERALSVGASQLRFGTETYAAKLRRGCRLAPLDTFVRSREATGPVARLLRWRTRVEEANLANIMSPGRAGVPIR